MEAPCSCRGSLKVKRSTITLIQLCFSKFLFR
jgi:hypothetical protein